MPSVTDVLSGVWLWLSTHIPLFIALIPVSTLGFTRFGMWILKRILGRFYRPVLQMYDTTATVVTPVYKEDPRLFQQAMDSWIANRPDRIIAVVDTSDTTCLEIARQYARQHPHIDVIPTDIPGKRSALALGVDATETDIVVLVDSDVVWDSDVLAKIKMPFADPRIGGVGTRQHMIPTDGRRPRFWERIADIYLDIRYCDEMPMSVAFGQAVSCLSGRTAAYRTQLLKTVREPFLNETFLGRHCMSGDDKCYTMLTLQHGYRTFIQLNAHVYSTFKPTFKGFHKQRLRWARNSFRSDFKALWNGWIWRYPFLAIVLLDKTLAPFLLIFGPLTLIITLALGHWHVALALLIWWMASRAIKLISHFIRKPLDLVIIPAYIPVAWFMTFVRFQALFSLNTHDWLTRPVAMVNGIATRTRDSNGSGQ